MGNISWTKSWSSSDNGTILYGQDLQNIQSDITAVVNGNITNTNVNASAAIVESKIAFNLTTGHDHDGTDSKLISFGASVRHYRNGGKIYGTGDDNIIVKPMAIDIGGTILTSTATSGNLAIATAGNWIYGAASNSSWCYVYVYNNSNTIGYKLSTQAPNLCDASDNTAEPVFRYRLYSGTYYRCIGAVYIDADGDLCFGHSGSKGLAVAQFDLSSSNTGWIAHDNTDPMVIVTLWTPQFVLTIPSAAEPPANGGTCYMTRAHKNLMDDYGLVQYAQNVPAYVTANTLAGVVDVQTTQAAGTPGSFSLKQTTSGLRIYYQAWTDDI